MVTAPSVRSAILTFVWLLGIHAAAAQGVLRIGMTASDIPLTTGQADNGGEGIRFVGQTLYDALIAWDLTRSDKPSELISGLATSWTVDPIDRNRWTFRIRPGVKFHDGSEFTADAAVWNFDKLLKPDAPQYDPRQSAQGKVRIPAVASYRAIDRLTLEVVTKAPDATLPYQLVYIAMSSPAQWEKYLRSPDERHSPTSQASSPSRCRLLPHLRRSGGHFVMAGTGRKRPVRFGKAVLLKRSNSI